MGWGQAPSTLTQGRTPLPNGHLYGVDQRVCCPSHYRLTVLSGLQVVAQQGEDSAWALSCSWTVKTNRQRCRGDPATCSTIRPCYAQAGWMWTCFCWYERMPSSPPRPVPSSLGPDFSVSGSVGLSSHLRMSYPEECGTWCICSG